MAGIYLHIPFCKRKCVYCNFYSIASQTRQADLVKCLKLELQKRKHLVDNEIIETIYFGGGTPSLLKSYEIDSVFETIFQNYSLSDTPEITLEANPDDITEEYLCHLAATPVNRLSIGIQSFHEADLKYLKRIHSSGQALNSVKAAQDKGFSNLSIDLIYGIPTLTGEGWLENIHKAIDLNVPHISCYSLTVEEGTPLPGLIKKGKLTSPEDEQSISQFRILMKKMKSGGYRHYEISNFCLPGMEAVHNTHYWKGKKYLGIGPSAHSFDGNTRSWNVASVTEYIRQVEEGRLSPQSEILSISDHYNEYVMTSLRTMWGIEIKTITDRFGPVMTGHFHDAVSEYLSSGKVIQKEGTYFLSDEGKLWADRIASDLFWVGEG